MMIDHKKKSCDNTVLWLEIGVKKHLALQHKVAEVAPHPTQQSSQMRGTSRATPKQRPLFFLTNFLATLIGNLRHYDGPDVTQPSWQTRTQAALVPQLQALPSLSTEATLPINIASVMPCNKC